MTCEHAKLIQKVTPSSNICEECKKIGGVWVRLRMCLVCGNVACCESSPHQHAKAHFHETDHPVIRSLDPREGWAYCYVDDEIIQKGPAPAS